MVTSRPRWLVDGAVLFGALALAVAVRVPYLLVADFPLNDGGMFLAMSDDLLTHDLRMPLFTTYNGGEIPFAYPPLGLYFAAMIARLGVPLQWSLRFLPFLFNLGTVAVFCGLACQLLGRNSRARLAVLLFPLLPFSYQWVMMGGGLTRSLGFLFATATVWATHRALTDRSRPAVAVAACLLAGAVLSHPEAGVFAIVTVGLVWFVLDRTGPALAWLAVIYAGAAMLSSPWWATVLARHGMGPFLGAASTSDWSLRSIEAVALFTVTAEPFLSLLGVLAIVGFWADATRGRAFLLIWAIVTLYVVPRSGHTPMTLPLALGAGMGLGAVVLPALARVGPGIRGASEPVFNEARLRLVRTAVLGWVFAYSLMSNWLVFSMGRHDLVPLGADERSALAWIAKNTPRSARFVVVTAAGDWSVDSTMEWFPALADRRSVLTVQGSEWLPAAEHRSRLNRYRAIKRCNSIGLSCLEAALSIDGVTWSHVYVSKAGRGPHIPHVIYQELHTSSHFQLAFENSGAAVFKLRR